MTHLSSKVDTLHFVEIPEGVDLQAEPAGPVPRALAFIIDLLIRWTFLSVISLLLLFIGQAGEGVLFILVFLSQWFYPVFLKCIKMDKHQVRKRWG